MRIYMTQKILYILYRLVTYGLNHCYITKDNIMIPEQTIYKAYSYNAVKNPLAIVSDAIKYD